MDEETKCLPFSILSQFPQIDEAAVDRLLENEIHANHDKIMVLDDDPTGVQTVHDVSVYTHWDETSVRKGFEEENKVFYILTNSRGMTAGETEKIHLEIAAAAEKASRETGKSFLLLSRSDSTLRGHYPLETEVLREEAEKNGCRIDGEILCPFFKEGGRYTIGNIHYVRQGDLLVPAAQTEFAKDRTFGYTRSSLPAYIEEKTGGAYRAADVTCIGLDDLRNLKYEKIEKQLEHVTGFGKVCVNAIDYCDLKVFCVSLYRALANGKHFLFRTAAGLVKVAGGISDRPLLTRRDMLSGTNAGGGIVVVGSHTEKTTAQLACLLQLSCTEGVAFNSDKVLESEESFAAEIARCIRLEEEIMRNGKTAVCYTSRRLLALPDDTKESALLRSVKIGDGVQKLVGGLSLTPAFVIAKGGITSSDIGTKALRVDRANVLGQICPGIPVWQTGPESRFPGIPYVIFPGNTGDETTLRQAVEILTETGAQG